MEENDSDTDSLSLRMTEDSHNEDIEEDLDIIGDAQFAGEPSDVDLDEAVMISHIAHYPLLWHHSPRTLKSSSKRLQDAEDCINDINAELLQKGSSKNIIADKNNLLLLLNKFKKKWKQEESCRRKYYNEVSKDCSAGRGYTLQWYNFQKFHAIAQGIVQGTYESSEMAADLNEGENMEDGCNYSINVQARENEQQTKLSPSNLQHKSQLNSQIQSLELISCSENTRKRPNKDNSVLMHKKIKYEIKSKIERAAQLDGDSQKEERRYKINMKHLVGSVDEEAVQHKTQLQEKESVEKKETTEKNKEMYQKKNMIEREDMQNEASIRRKKLLQEKVNNRFKKSVDTNILKNVIIQNKKIIGIKNAIEKDNEVLENEMTIWQEKEAIQEDYEITHNENDDLQRGKEKKLAYIVADKNHQSSENDQVSVMHLPHEPVCHIKEEPLEDPVENNSTSNNNGQLDDWSGSESACVESDDLYKPESFPKINFKGHNRKNYTSTTTNSTTINSTKVLLRGRPSFRKKKCKSQQKPSKRLEKTYHVDVLKKLREENARLIELLNKSKEVNGPKESAILGFGKNGEMVAPHNDELTSEMILVKIPISLGDKSYYCATCTFKSIKKSEIIRHSFVHLIKNRHVSVPGFETKVLNKEKCSTLRSYQCPKCHYKCSRKSSLKVHLESHKYCENEFYAPDNDPDDPEYVEEEIATNNDPDYVAEEINNEHNHHKKIAELEDKETSIITTKTLKCSKCHFKTHNQEDLDIHIEIHANSKEYICIKCKKHLHSKLRFNKHVRLYHLPKALACTLCDYKASEKFMLEWHLNQHTGEISYHCHHCKERFDNNWTFKNHCILVHKLEKYFNCTDCDFVAKEVNEIDDHMFTHSGIKPIQCSDCDFKCCKPRQLTKHKKLKHEEALIKCSKCNFQTKYYSKFDEHLSTHTWDIKYFCYLCNESINGLSSFKDHRVHSHNLENYLHCAECDYNGENIDKLAIHMFKHCKKKLLQCSNCEFSTNSSVFIKRHMHSKHGDFPFQCTECDYKTNDKIPFDRHILGHTLAIEYYCYHCKEQFDHLWTFKRHRQEVHNLLNYLNCMECNFTAVNMNSLAQHMFNHSGIKALQCSQCDYSGCQFTHIKRHIQLKHGKASYKCIPCNYKTSEKIYYDKHMSEEHNDKGTNYQCYHCQEKFEHLWTLKNHCRIIHKLENYLACSECDYIANDVNDVGEHVAKHRDMVSLQCSQCDYTSYQPMNLECHVQLKHGAALTYHCNECDFNSSNKDSYMNHVNKHRGDIQFDCSHCKQNFDGLSHLKKHFLEEHKIENYLACTECDYVGKNQAHLARHLYEEHKMGNLMQCPQCQYTSCWPRELQDHMRVNHGGAPLRCPVCDKGFTAKNDLERHIRSHTGEKPFLCEDCGKRFPAKRSLKNHIDVVHKEIRPFPCTECDRKFPNKSEFDIHMRTHKEGKKFVCDTCGTGFLKRNALNKHMEIHQDKLYKCPDCGFLCKTSSNIRQHLMVRHEYKAKDGYRFDTQSMLISGENISSKQIQNFNKTYAKPEKKVKEREHSDKLFQCPHCYAYKGNTRMAIRTHMNKVHGLFAKKGYKFNFESMLVTDPDPGIIRPHFKAPFQTAHQDQHQLQEVNKPVKKKLHQMNHLNMGGVMHMNEDSSNATNMQGNNAHNGYGMPVDLAIPRNCNIAMQERGYTLSNVATLNEGGYMVPNLGEFSRHSTSIEATEQQRLAANRFYSMAGPYNQFMLDFNN